MSNITQDTFVSPDHPANQSETDHVSTLNGRRTCLNDYPLFLTVKEISEMTGLKTAACYDLLRVTGCPKIRLKGQAKYVVPRDAFYQFLLELSSKDPVLTGMDLS